MRVGAGLSETTRGMQEVVGALRQACAHILGESSKVHRSIDSARRHLQNTFADHTAACRCGRHLPLPTLNSLPMIWAQPVASQSAAPGQTCKSP